MNIGYISPNGKIYVCDSYGHLDLAEAICIENNYIDEIKKLTRRYSRLDCEQYLISKGYLAIYSRDVDHGCNIRARINQIVFPLVKLSNTQEQYIKDNLNNAFNSDQLDSMYKLLESNEYVDERNNIPAIYFS